MSQRTDSKNLPRVEFQVHFQTGHRGRKCLRNGTSSNEPEHLNEDLPRLTRLLALAHRWNRLIEEGVVTNYSEIARMMGLSRARVTQIMTLLYLAPDIQEEFLLSKVKGNPASNILERTIRHITRIPDWTEQRELLRNLRDEKFRPTKHPEE